MLVIFDVRELPTLPILSTEAMMTAPLPCYIMVRHAFIMT